ncbi:hypothetical protein I3843_14G129600 [Carya illinoinensis]|nr:hypothetical protein I3843_14G129600 [Carya illinoinensis]
MEKVIAERKCTRFKRERGILNQRQKQGSKSGSYLVYKQRKDEFHKVPDVLYRNKASCIHTRINEGEDQNQLKQVILGGRIIKSKDGSEIVTGTLELFIYPVHERGFPIIRS